MAHYAHKRKKRLGNYPIVSLVFSITLALFMMGLFGLLILHTEKLAALVRENVEIQIYLNKNISESERSRIKQLLANKEFVLRKNGSAQITFMTKEEAAQRFIEETGEDFLFVLDENPLRDAYILNIDPNYQDTEHLEKIKQEIETMKEVFEVTYIENFVASINKNMAKIKIILATFSIILLFAVTILIYNTIKLAIYSQRFLIRSMQLVGATANFIKRPFLARSVLLGLIAGTITSILLLTLLYYANLQIEALIKLQEPTKIFMLSGAIILLGVFISLLSTYSAINKYLSMSLDDLY
ncbi:MAG: permease-like cell division protein FtsX [Cytophagales bacterium]|nr:permease-like cell division protein FtsX [Cytophagales bacterium]